MYIDIKKVKYLFKNSKKKQKQIQKTLIVFEISNECLKLNRDYRPVCTYLQTYMIKVFNPDNAVYKYNPL